MSFRVRHQRLMYRWFRPMAEARFGKQAVWEWLWEHTAFPFGYPTWRQWMDLPKHL